MAARNTPDQILQAVAATGGNNFHRVSTNHSREIFARSGDFDASASCWASDFREMLKYLAQLEFSPERASPLQKVCNAGSEYGLGVLKKSISSGLLSLLRPKAKRHIKNDLRRSLVQVTRPSFALQLTAFRLAHGAIYSQTGPSTRMLIEKKFLGERPYNRLVALFKEFPVLAELWSQLIYAWCDSVSDFLARVKRDKRKLSRVFFRGQPVGKIIDLRAGLSDPHNNGRTVMRVQFQAGSIIYKPRCGHGEKEWFSLVDHLNAASLRPKLSAASVLCRDGYCWMQEVKSASCKDEAAARRFYKRLGAMIAAASLLKAVDCHRDNVIACGEHPVLVDAETLWHVADEKKTKISPDSLFATGFLPSSGPRSSYHYRSSVLGRTAAGNHIPHIGGKLFYAERCEAEIIYGFRKAWRCLLGTAGRRATFTRRLQRLGRRELRRIYWSTRNYDAIMRASIQPAVLRSGVARIKLIARLCRRTGIPETIIDKEINDLGRLDIPYFTRQTTVGSPLLGENAPPAGIIEALRRAVYL